MNIDYGIKCFLEEHIDLIDENKFFKLFKLADETYVYEFCKNLSIFLESANIIEIAPYREQLILYHFNDIFTQFKRDNYYKDSTTITLSNLLLNSFNQETIFDYELFQLEKFLNSKRDYIKQVYDLEVCEEGAVLKKIQ